MQNSMKLRFRALSQNESFARVVAGAFSTQLNPTINELTDIKTAVSEAVTNAIIHGYSQSDGEVELDVAIDTDMITIVVRDFGVGIDDIMRAREPFYTTWPGDERSGMGFTVMETFMDSVDVESKVGEGTTVTMTKRINMGDNV